MLDVRWDFLGLSTEAKPTTATGKVVNGSTFYEVDTSKLYIYYNNNWVEQDLGGGGSEGQTIQYDEMPEASSTLEDKIIQYVGDTTESYTNGYFYKCVGDGGDPEVFSWQEVDVQDVPQPTPEIYFIDATNSSSSPFVFEGKKKGIYVVKSASGIGGNNFYYKVNNDSNVKSLTNMFIFEIELYEDIPKITETTSNKIKFRYFVFSGGNIVDYKISQCYFDYVSSSNVSISMSGTSNFGQFVNGSTQTFSGLKKFSTIPQQSNTNAPTDDKEFANKKYVDDQVAGAGGGEKVYVLDLDEVLPNAQTYERIISYQTFNTSEVRSALSDIITDASQKGVGYINLDVLCYNNTGNKRNVRFKMIYVVYTQGTEYNRVQWIHGVESTGYDASGIAINCNYAKIYINNAGMSWSNGVCTVTQVNTAEFDEFTINGPLDLSAIAPEYDSSETYAVGDYVTHNNGLYKCINPSSAEGYFNPANWQQTTVMEVIGNL